MAINFVNTLAYKLLYTNTDTYKHATSTQTYIETDFVSFRLPIIVFVFGFLVKRKR